jgi:mono/diheme cytochrome c family protein
MNRIKITFLFVSAVMLSACSSSKKSATAPAPAPAPTAATVTPYLPPPVMKKPVNGVFPPRNEQLTAIQATHPEVSMQTLTEGYKIYTGACTNCHHAKNIYSFPEDAWPAIMDDMAHRARISHAEKDAVYKYVLAIKATQPK